MIERLCRRLAATLANSLLQYRLANTSAYSWTNALLLFAVTLHVALALARCTACLTVRALLLARPRELVESSREIMLYLRGFDILSTLEHFFFRLQVHCLKFVLALIVICMLGELLRGLGFRHRRRLLERYEGLPVSSRHVMWILFDWPYLKFLAAGAIMFMAYLLPVRGNWFDMLGEYVRFPYRDLLSWWSLLSHGLREAIRVLCVYLLFLPPLFAVHRMIVIFHYRKSSGLVRRWVAGWAFWLAVVMFIGYVLHRSTVDLDRADFFILCFLFLANIPLLTVTLHIPEDLFKMPEQPQTIGGEERWRAWVAEDEY